MYLRRLNVVNLFRRTSLRTSLQSSLSLLIVVTTSWLLFGKLAVAQSDSDLFELKSGHYLSNIAMNVMVPRNRNRICDWIRNPHVLRGALVVRLLFRATQNRVC